MHREELDYTRLSTTYLISLFCADPPDRGAFDELWMRNQPTARRFARHLTRMCPDPFSREIFEEDVFSETQERVLRQICAYQRRVPFSAWLWMVSQGAALDKRRKIAGRDPRRPRWFVPLAEDELARSGALFKDALKQDPVRRVLKSERSAIVKQVFEQYSATQEGFESLSALKLHFYEEQSVKEIAMHFLTYERKIYRMLVHDCEALRNLFRQAGVGGLEDVFMEYKRKR